MPGFFFPVQTAMSAQAQPAGQGEGLTLLGFGYGICFRMHAPSVDLVTARATFIAGPGKKPLHVAIPGDGGAGGGGALDTPLDFQSPSFESLGLFSLGPNTGRQSQSGNEIAGSLLSPFGKMLDDP